MHETVAAGARAYLWVVLACVAVGLALTPVVPWFAKGLPRGRSLTSAAAGCIQLAAFVPLVLLPLRSVFDARQLGYVVNLLLIGQSLLITGASLCSSPGPGWGITRAGGGAGDSAAGRSSLALSAGVFRTHPGLLRAVLTMPTTPETRARLRNLSLPTLLLNVSGRVSVLSDELVVGFLHQYDAGDVPGLHAEARGDGSVGPSGRRQRELGGAGRTARQGAVRDVQPPARRDDPDGGRARGVSGSCRWSPTTARSCGSGSRPSSPTAATP